MKKTIIFLALISSVSHAKDVINLKSLSGTELVGVKMTSLNTGGTTQFLDANKIILKSNIKGNTNSCIGDYQISKVTSAGGHNLVAERGNVFIAITNIKCTGEVLARKSYWDPISVAEYEENPYLLELPEKFILGEEIYVLQSSLNPDAVSGDGDILRFTR